MKGELPIVDRAGIEKGEKPVNDNNNSETPEQRGKGEKSELISLQEFINEAGETMTAVVQALERERGYAAEVRKMGARVTRETAQKIADLEKQRDRLEQALDETAHDLAFTNWIATKREATTEKPLDEMVTKKLRTPELEALLNDPDAIDITDDMVVEVQSELELKLLDANLQEEADNAQFEMANIIEQLHDIKKKLAEKSAPAASAPRKGLLGRLAARLGVSKSSGESDPGLRKDFRSILDNRAAELQRRITQLNRQDASEVDEVDRAYAKARAQERDSANAELSRILGQTADMDRADIEAGAEPVMSFQEGMSESVVAILESRFNDLQNYTRTIKEKLKDVRVDLGLVKGLDQRPTKKMPPPLPSKAA